MKNNTPSRNYVMIFLLILFSATIHVQAQTTLATGDISIIGFNSSLLYRDGFAFVPWVDLQAGTVIKFTDDSYNSSASAISAGNIYDQEQLVTWTATSAITAGTVIKIEGNGSDPTMVASTGTVTVTNANGTTALAIGLSSADQIFAFQGGSISPSNTTTSTMASNTVMLYGIGWQGSSSYTTWLSSGTATTLYSYLPSELSSNSLFLASNAVAGEYSGSRTGMTVAQYKAAINNTANWTYYTSGLGVAVYNTTALTIALPPSITGQPSNASICVGANTSFAITASNASSYQWQVNTGSGFSNVSNTGVYSGATTATLSITGATTSMNSYQYKCIATGSVSPTATSNSATLTVSSTSTWLGGTSVNWNNTANWSCGILPTASTDVTIPSGTTYSPQVNSTTAICNNLTINSGATLSFAGTTNILEIKGTVTNNGTFTASSGTLKLSGTSTQTIPGLAYKDLTVNGSGTKTLAASATISGTLTLTTGYLQLGAYNLTLLGTTASATSVDPLFHTSFIITNSTGQLKIQNIGAGGRTGTVVFPVGTSTSSYTPVKITNAGTADEFGVRVINSVYRSYNASGVPTGTVQNTYNVGKTWLITENTAGGSNATLNFGWESMDEQAGFNDGACTPAHYYGGYWHSSTSAVTANGFDPYDVDLTNVTSFSPFAVGSQFSMVLPLDLLSFTGKTNESNTVLTWVTANEKAVAGFEVERSADGRSYERIANVPARSNNSNSENTYNYTDATAATGAWYYRLKMLDVSGTYKYSSVVHINRSANEKAAYSISPNPVKGNVLNLVTPLAGQQEVDVRIIDAAGRVWHKETVLLNTGKVGITTTALPAGMYYLQVRNQKTGVVQMLKFRKES